jgi:hypothetical protein
MSIEYEPSSELILHRVDWYLVDIQPDFASKW